jgi:hypothetical protein
MAAQSAKNPCCASGEAVCANADGHYGLDSHPVCRVLMFFFFLGLTKLNDRIDSFLYVESSHLPIKAVCLWIVDLSSTEWQISLWRHKKTTKIKTEYDKHSETALPDGCNRTTLFMASGTDRSVVYAGEQASIERPASRQQVGGLSESPVS